MIVVKILGGLGNQMFQYALGLKLSLETGRELVLDVSSLIRHKDKPYDLEFLNISARMIRPLDYWKLGMGPISYPLVRLKKHPAYYREKQFTFSDDIFHDKRKTLYLDGYFQSEKYFFDIKDQLVKEFSPKFGLGEENNNLIERMHSTQSCSIHIRRGDYVTNAAANSLLGVQPLSYYEKAMEIVNSRFEHTEYFVFSDDLDWVKSNLSFSRPVTYVDTNRGENSYRDLFVMSECKNNILANSSFSWWAAWLNKNPQKLVIAPIEWFKNHQLDSRDLVPSTWMRI